MLRTFGCEDFVRSAEKAIKYAWWYERVSYYNDWKLYLFQILQKLLSSHISLEQKNHLYSHYQLTLKNLVIQFPNTWTIVIRKHKRLNVFSEIFCGIPD